MSHKSNGSVALQMRIFKWLHLCFNSKHSQKAQCDLGSSTKHLPIYSLLKK